MIRRFFTFLYAAEPIVFHTDLALDQAVASLRSATSRSVFRFSAREAATGTVTKQKASLRRANPFAGNSFKPFFVGRFSSSSDGIILQGVFTMHWMEKIFMTFWFGFFAFWTLLTLFAVIAKATELWFFPLLGLCMFFLGFALVRVGEMVRPQRPAIPL
jgi:hypothetical protein